VSGKQIIDRMPSLAEVIIELFIECNPSSIIRTFILGFGEFSGARRPVLREAHSLGKKRQGMGV
jgi:hypothetical protein